jgi:hypothetical protein
MNIALTARQRKKLEYWTGAKPEGEFCPDTNDDDFAILMEKLEKEEIDPKKSKSVKDHMRFSACVAALKYLTDQQFLVPASVLAQVQYSNAAKPNTEQSTRRRGKNNGNKHR